MFGPSLSYVLTNETCPFGRNSKLCIKWAITLKLFLKKIVIANDAVLKKKSFNKYLVVISDKLIFNLNGQSKKRCFCPCFYT